MPTNSSASAQALTPSAAQNPNAIFFAMLAESGIPVPTDMTTVVSDGRNICKCLPMGHTPAAAAEQTSLVHPSSTATQSSGYVYAAIDAYCPKYEN